MTAYVYIKVRMICEGAGPALAVRNTKEIAQHEHEMKDALMMKSPLLTCQLARRPPSAVSVSACTQKVRYKGSLGGALH